MTDFDRARRARALGAKRPPDDAPRLDGLRPAAPSGDVSRAAALDETAEYFALLRDISAPAEPANVDWDAFYAELNDRAALPLARLRRSASAPHVTSSPAASTMVVEAAANALDMESPTVALSSHAETWWELAARWRRSALSAASAAAIVLGTFIHFHPVGPVRTSDLAASSIVASATAATDARATFVAAVEGGVSSGAAMAVFVPTLADDALAEAPSR